MNGMIKKTKPTKFGVIGPSNLGKTLLRKLSTFGETYYYNLFRDQNNDDPEIVKSVSMTKVLDCDVVFITVKPSSASIIFAIIKREITVQVPIFISVMTGVPMSFLRKELGNHSIVRMTTDISIGEIGISGKMFAYSPPELKSRLIDMTRPMGRIVWIENEDKLDAATALFAYGPAFISKFFKPYQEIAKEMGFDKDFVLDLFDSTIFMLSRISPETIISDIVLDKGIENLSSLDENVKMAIKGSYEECQDIRSNFLKS